MVPNKLMAQQSKRLHWRGQVTAEQKTKFRSGRPILRVIKYHDTAGFVF